MMIDNLQKAILNCLNNQSSDNFLKLNGIFNYIDKNQELPILLILLKKLKIFLKILIICLQKI